MYRTLIEKDYRLCEMCIRDSFPASHGQYDRFRLDLEQSFLPVHGGNAFSAADIDVYKRQLNTCAFCSMILV